MQYYNKLNNVPPAYYNLVYGSGKFKNFMFARLYFSTYIDTYKAAGLANVDWSAPKYFTKDQSFEEGFVETWKINDPSAHTAPDSAGSPLDVYKINLWDLRSPLAVQSATTTTIPVMQKPKDTGGVFKYGSN
jgi:hypothetical protein